MDINNRIIYFMILISIISCTHNANEVHFCNEFNNKFIRFRLSEEYKLLSNPDLKNNVNIDLRYQNIDYNQFHYIDFGTKIADLYTNGSICSDKEFASKVFKGLQEDERIDSIYQINNLLINEISFVTYSIRRKQMGYNIWFESIHFNLVDSNALLVRTMEFDTANKFELVKSKHYDLLNSIEFGVCPK